MKEAPGQPFDQGYFERGPYASVSFKRFSQYWWSNRFYAKLALRHGPKSGRVLEVGCGLGHLLSWFREPYRVVGADINPSALEQARRNVPGGEFLQLSAENLGAFADRSFQIVIAKHVVEHLREPGKSIAEISRVLADGGLLILATPNLDSPMRARKKEQWAGYRDPTHISLKPPDEWLAMLRTNRLQPRKIFSDGFWDTPYRPLLPTALQKLLYGAPGGMQAILGWPMIPLRMGESLIVLADKE